MDGGGPVGESAAPHRLSAPDPLTPADGDGLEVRNGRLPTPPVVDGDRVPSGHLPGEGHPAGGDRVDDRARVGPVVPPPVAGVAADRSELGDDRPGHRR